ncbi:hypothetical protein BaRGS_00007240, partial [Batillaria attramentaria]
MSAPCFRDPPGRPHDPATFLQEGNLIEGTTVDSGVVRGSGKQRRQREKRNVERRAAGDCRCPP